MPLDDELELLEDELELLELELLLDELELEDEVELLELVLLEDEVELADEEELDEEELLELDELLEDEAPPPQPTIRSATMESGNRFLFIRIYPKRFLELLFMLCAKKPQGLRQDDTPEAAQHTAAWAVFDFNSGGDLYENTNFEIFSADFAIPCRAIIAPPPRPYAF